MILPLDRIDRMSKVPLYQQLYEILRGKISRGEWTSGDMIPPESELIEQYEVSRATVRQVLDMLVNEDLIYRQRGRGTFIAHPTMKQGLTRIISFTEDMQQRGYQPGTKICFSGIIPAPDDIAAKLEISPGEELARLERLRLADGEPMSLEQSNLVHRYCPGILKGDYAEEPLRRALERDYGIRLVSANQVIRAVSASKEVAELLSVQTGSPLLFIERVTYSHQRIPVEFLRIHYRADRYSLYSELHE
ncbi:MAG: UTRA domain-containing protein [Anaerolineales bacterium]|nr:UTRA domain-containing protein [Anaerolineales bacterium]